MAASAEDEIPPAPPPAGVVPITVLSGYLGAGKTTIMRSIMRGSGSLRIAFLVNDMGAVGIDMELMTMDSAGLGRQESLMALPAGCVCCAIEEDGVEASIRKLLARGTWDHIMLETSGVADTSSFAAGLAALRLEGAARLANVVVVVDAQAYSHRLRNKAASASSEELLHVRQLRAADTVVLTKCDLLDDGSGLDTRVVDVEAAIRRTVGDCSIPILRSALGHLHISALLHVDPSFEDKQRKGRSAASTQPLSHLTSRTRLMDTFIADDQGISSVACPSVTPCDAGALQDFLARRLPKGLLRAKGFFRLEGSGTVVEMQISGRRNVFMKVHDGTSIRSASMAVVFIGIDLDKESIQRQFAACCRSDSRHSTGSEETPVTDESPPRSSREMTESSTAIAKDVSRRMRADNRFSVQSTAESRCRADTMVAFSLIAAPWDRDENSAINLAFVNEMNSSNSGLVVLPTRDDDGDTCILFDTRSSAGLEKEDILCEQGTPSIECPQDVWGVFLETVERTLAAAFFSNYCCGRCPF